jgi:UDP-2,3-diacylglucosamine pyrophosphatase LpxH
MFKTWTSSSREIEPLARALEAHLNEFADEVVSVAYAVTDRHHVLALYKQVELSNEDHQEVAVSEAEYIIEEVQA